MDLDIGLTAALLDRGKYREISDRLRRAGFAPDDNAAGNPTRQRWKIVAREKVTIDFLMPPTSADERGGSLRDLEPDFAAEVAIQADVVGFVGDLLRRLGVSASPAT